jgi:hypothetical protein
MWSGAAEAGDVCAFHLTKVKVSRLDGVLAMTWAVGLLLGLQVAAAEIKQARRV